MIRINFTMDILLTQFLESLSNDLIGRLVCRSWCYNWHWSRSLASCRIYQHQNPKTKLELG